MSVYVNRVEISEEEIGREMQYHPAPSRERAWQLAAQALVVRQLFLQQAAEDGLYAADEDDGTPGPAEEEAIDRLLNHNISIPDADEATCRRFYDMQSDSFIDKDSGRRLEFEQAHAQIRGYLHTKAMRAAIAEYIRALSLGAKIKGIELVNL